MTKIVYNADLMKFIALFESLSGAEVKDCFIDNNDLLTFVVKENNIGIAIGKNASNVKKLESLLKRKIKIVEFNPTLREFIHNLIMPIKAEEIQIENDSVIIKGGDSRTKGMLIGRGGSKLRNYENIVNKYFDVESIKII